MKDFKELEVWKKARRLNIAVYKATEVFPTQEQYGIISQMRRCSVSIAANIAEGCGRRSDPELARFLKIARGSAFELECHVLLAFDLGFLPSARSEELQEKIHEVQRMLMGLIQSVEFGKAELGSQRQKSATARS